MKDRRKNYYEIKKERARLGYMTSEDKKYQMFMCKKCKFFIENHCTKNRIIRLCARKGLKNKD